MFRSPEEKPILMIGCVLAARLASRAIRSVRAPGLLRVNLRRERIVQARPLVPILPSRQAHSHTAVTRHIRTFKALPGCCGGGYDLR